jgi:hypothetical protein
MVVLPDPGGTSFPVPETGHRMSRSNSVLRQRRLALSAVAMAAITFLPLLTTVSSPSSAAADTVPAPAVNGDPSWVASVTTKKQEIAPGVDLLTLNWGSTGPDDRWYVLVSLPTDPVGSLATATMNLGPKPSADRAAEALRNAGYQPTVEPVSTPSFADAPAGTLGWTVKVGSYGTAAEASTTLAELRAKGFAGAARYSAQDGTDDDAPQAGYVLRVDFDEYHGRLVAEHGPDLAVHETLTDLIASTGAIAGINAHWAYGEAIAGLYVKDGRVIGGSITQGRGGVLVREGGRLVDVDSYTGHFWMSVENKTIEVDGVNRLPGRIQNCGGVGGDTPWPIAQHDRFCTDSSELIRFTSDWGAPPVGPGAEVVLDSRGRVTAVNAQRGATAPAGGTTIQGIGESAQWLLDNVKVGDLVRWREEIRDSAGKKVQLTADTTIMQVGPTLIDDGDIEINARADGLFWEGVNPSFTYNWVLRSNPRSSIAIDDQGRLLLAVFDGRQPGYAEGVSIFSHAQILKRLGAVEALNLDGGGSSVIATSDAIVNRPSDAGNRQRRQNNAWLLTP